MKTYKKVFIILWIIAGLLTITSTLNELQKKSDSEIVRRINNASNKISSYVSSKKVLPKSLQEAGVIDTEGITYKIESDSVYELCATFKISKPGYKSGTSLSSGVHVYSHDSGYQCFKAEPYQLKELAENRNVRIYPNEATPQTRNIERKTDIKAIHGQIEAFYAKNGRYPTLANMNDKTFRATNLKGLDVEALKDPIGLSILLAPFPAIDIYSYEATATGGGACDNVSKYCTKYTLTATYEGGGGTYTKTNLN